MATEKTVETKSNDSCSKCKKTDGLSDVKIQNQDVGKLCQEHFAEFQNEVIVHFKSWIQKKAA